MTGEEFSKQSEWHDVFGSLGRLNYWLQEGNLRAFGGDYVKRKEAHDRFYMEIVSKLSKDERKEIEDVQREIEEDLGNLENTRRSVSSKVPQLLNKYEQLIRSFADKHEMLLPNKQDPGSSILR